MPLLQVVKASMRRAAHDERATMNERETAALQVEDLTYNADGLIPCIVQDVETREVLMMAWMKKRCAAPSARVQPGSGRVAVRNSGIRAKNRAIHRSWLNFVTIVMPTPCLP